MARYDKFDFPLWPTPAENRRAAGSIKVRPALGAGSD